MNDYERRLAMLCLVFLLLAFAAGMFFGAAL